MQFLNGFIGTGHIGESHLRHVLGKQLRLGLAELHDLGAAALHPGDQEPEDGTDHDDRQHQGEEATQEIVLHRLIIVLIDLGAIQIADHVFDPVLDHKELHVFAQVLIVLVVIVLECQIDSTLCIDLGGLNFAIGDQGHSNGSVYPSRTA